MKAKKRPWKVYSDFNKTKTFATRDMAWAEAQLQSWVYGQKQETIILKAKYKDGLESFYVTVKEE